MAGTFRIGLFSSAWDAVAWKLVLAVHNAVKAGEIPNAEIAFLLCTREEGETPFGDLLIENARKARLPLITFSSLRFKPDLRQRGREAKAAGDPSVLEIWRQEHDQEIARRICPTNLDVLLGYMWECSGAMCQTRTMINLHPALPEGPKGTYKEVIWELIESKATETGVMMHLVTENLDRGPAVSYCRFSIRGGEFDQFWEDTGDDYLFYQIRYEGVRREFPMVIGAIRNIAMGNIRIENGSVLDSQGQVLANGYDLTQEIDDAILRESGKEML